MNPVPPASQQQAPVLIIDDPDLSVLEHDMYPVGPFPVYFPNIRRSADFETLKLALRKERMGIANWGFGAKGYMVNFRKPGHAMLGKVWADGYSIDDIREIASR
jgi:hypothetical protein